MVACRDIGLGKLHIPELLGAMHIQEVSPEGAYQTKLDTARVQNEQLVGLLRRYANRKSFSCAQL